MIAIDCLRRLQTNLWVVGGLVAALGTGGAACGTAGDATPSESLATTRQALTLPLPLFNTGVDATGTVTLANGATELHYTITGSTDPGRPVPPVRPAIVTAPNAAWAAAAAGAKWISLDAVNCTTCVMATYTYKTTFVMPANANLATATIALRVGADDSVVIFLNGTQVFTGGGYTALTNVTIGPAQAAFVAGTNTLTFADVNTIGPSGLLIENIAGFATDACVVDSDCQATDFCNTTSLSCTPKLANGTAIPTIGGHAPPLAGVCTNPVGGAVCSSGVCDTADNACGFANGDGPCTSANAANVCRSGTCGAGLLCVPAGGGCTLDAECLATQYCNTQTFACASKLANGAPIPAISGHTPALTGACSAPVAASVCASAACDPGDNACGFANGDGICSSLTAGTVCRSGVCDAADLTCGLANGDGPCTAATGPNVCRSGACGAGLVCIPAGGCTVDIDCTAAQFCNTQTLRCVPKLANGTAIPSIAGHTTPPLTGACTPAAGAAVCASGVCDAVDGKCGLTAGQTCGSDAVCRSMICLASVCRDLGMDAGADADAGTDAAAEAAAEAGPEAGSDATADAARDAPAEAESGTGSDGSADASRDAPPDGPREAAAEAAADATADAQADAHADGAVDATPDVEAMPDVESDAMADATSDSGGAPPDAEADADAPTEPAIDAGPTPPDNSSVEGGGISCSASSGRGRNPASLALLWIGLAGFSLRRRLRRIRATGQDRAPFVRS